MKTRPRYFTGNAPKKFKWFFPILRTYGWYHWFHHTDVGQVLYFMLYFVGAGITLFIFWILLSVFILADPSFGYYH